MIRLRRSSAHLFPLLVDSTCKVIEDPAVVALIMPHLEPLAKVAVDKMTNLEVRSQVEEALKKFGKSVDCKTVVAAKIPTIIRAALGHKAGSGDT